MSNSRSFTLYSSILFWFAIFFVALQLISAAGQFTSIQVGRHEAIDNIESRVILDSAFLDIGNATLSTPVNTFMVTRYIDEINANLATNKYPLRVYSLQGVTSNNSDPNYQLSHAVQFDNAEQQITLSLYALPIQHAIGFSWWALIFAALLAPLFSFYRQQKTPQPTLDTIEQLPTPKLVIDLREKTLGNNVNDTVFVLQNKPLCFYSALVSYCTLHPNQALPPHKDVPIELITMANKTFSRLIELGHTKRKRPDFNANLDKTLSEIRAALEEVFAPFPQEKERYYPPRAQGEGSRSKLHSYALNNISPEDIEIIGN